MTLLLICGVWRSEFRHRAMREGTTGIYFGVDGKLGYSMCMLRTKTLWGRYRDPILPELWRSSGVGDKVEDPWFIGYETDPRWLRLVRSGVGIRSVARGFALQRPDDEENLLTIPQEHGGGELVDSGNRVEAGAALLRDFVKAGL